MTTEKVAIKILEKDRIVEQADVERVAREIHILKLLRHPNIIQLYEVKPENCFVCLFIEKDYRNTKTIVFDHGVCQRR